VLYPKKNWQALGALRLLRGSCLNIHPKAPSLFLPHFTIMSATSSFHNIA
jgi:hypothetical protein